MITNAEKEKTMSDRKKFQPKNVSPQKALVDLNSSNEFHISSHDSAVAYGPPTPNE